MIPPHPPGALAYAPLRFTRTHRCRFCGQEFTTTNGTAQTCPACYGGEAWRAWRFRNRKRWDANWKARKA